jgi:sialidase-1
MRTPFVFCLLPLFSVISLTVARAASEKPTLTDVFQSGADGYRSYRIPSVIVAPKGTVLAFCEGRKFSAGDQTPTDLVLKRSQDGGKTWLPMQIVVPGVPHAMMDPCPVVDRTTGTIHLAYDRWPDKAGDTVDGKVHRKTGLGLDSVTGWFTTSTDDGTTWSEPRNVTATTKMPEWAGFAHGPGVGIQTRSGRLVVPCNHYHDNRRCFVIYSDDRGRTWQLGGQVGPLVSECQAVELADGRLMLNMRSYRGKNCRAVAFSSDGGQTWTDFADAPALIEPVCQGSTIRYTAAGPKEKSRLLFCNPADLKKRIKLTVRVSYDEGQTWPVAKTLYEGPSAYSCLTVLPDLSIGCLFERDNYAKITFARFSLDWLTDGKDRIEP